MPRQTAKRSNLFLCESYLRRRWLEGETNVKELLAETKTFGYNGSYTILANFLSTYSRSEAESVLPPPRKANRYSSRQICRLLNRISPPLIGRPMKNHF